MVPAQLYRVGEIEIDAAAIAFTGVVALVIAVAFGLAPALQSARVAITDTLKETHAAAGGTAKRRLARGLFERHGAVTRRHALRQQDPR